MKNRLLAALLCALLIAALIPGSAWSEGVPGDGSVPTYYPDPDGEPDPVSTPTPHIHAEHLYTIAAKPATCTDGGNIGYYICECGQWFKDAGATEVIYDHSTVLLSKLDHDPQPVLDKPATCAEEGHTAGFLCSMCGQPVEGYEAPQTIPKLDHSPAEVWSSDADGHWHVCTVCGERLDSAAHVSGGAATATRAETCTVCGYEIGPATGYVAPSPTPGGTIHPTPRPTPTPTPTPEVTPEPTPEPQPGELLVTRISFRDTGDTQMDELTEEQPDAQTEKGTTQLPHQRPESEGWFFDGWRCSADGALYQPGDELSFRWADTRQITMTAEWTALIGRGNYDLTAGMRYRFGEGSFLIDGDSTVYAGGSTFYVRENGNYTIR